MAVIVNGHYLVQRVTGVQRYAIEIVKQFEKLGLTYWIEEMPDLLTKNKPTHHFWEQFMLPTKQNDGDVLWSPTNTGPVMASNQVITFHDIAVFPHPEWFSKNYVRWRQKLIPMLAKKAQGIITVSEFSRGIIREHIDISPDKVKAIHNGVNRKHFYPTSSKAIARIKNKLGLQSNYILTLGSLDPRKNLKGILQAWTLLRQEHPSFDYQLVVAGGKGKNFSEEFELDDFNEDNIKYLGYVDDEDLAPLYSGASLFVYPSLFEGFGLPVLEAMSCGTPVVTSNTGALKEISEGAAELVDPNRPEDIAQGVLNVTDSGKLSENLVHQGLQRVEQFSWEKSARETYEYLQMFT